MRSGGRFAGQSTTQLVEALLRSRGGRYLDPLVADTMAGLRILAARHRDLTAQIDLLTDRIAPQVARRTPPWQPLSGSDRSSRPSC